MIGVHKNDIGFHLRPKGLGASQVFSNVKIPVQAGESNGQSNTYRIMVFYLEDEQIGI